MNNWPTTEQSQEFEINLFIDSYKKFSHGRIFSILSSGEKPDYTVKDENTNEVFGVELTSVYLDDRSVPDLHMREEEGISYLPNCQNQKKLYKKRIIEKIKTKIKKAKNGYDLSNPLILSIYANEYITIHMGDSEWEDFAAKNRKLWDSMYPFIEIVLCSLRDGKSFSIRAETKEKGLNL